MERRPVRNGKIACPNPDDRYDCWGRITYEEPKLIIANPTEQVVTRPFLMHNFFAERATRES